MHGDVSVSSRSLCLPGACEEGEGRGEQPGRGVSGKRREEGGGGGGLGIEGDGE